MLNISVETLRHLVEETVRFKDSQTLKMEALVILSLSLQVSLHNYASVVTCSLEDPVQQCTSYL